MNVVVAIDFSEITSVVLDALPRLLCTPSAEGIHVYLVHVAEPDPEFVGWDTGPDVVRDQVAEEFKRGHKQLAELAGGLREALNTDVTPLLIQGPTAKSICKQADALDAGMIVVGSHGYGAAYNLVVGSISSAVIKQSQRAVLVIPVASGA
jgi:nucleotide-binding universal stress UspA family protein